MVKMYFYSILSLSLGLYPTVKMKLCCVTLDWLTEMAEKKWP